ncbi:MAG: hypothetical protein IBJ09_11330 [Bacteroidia bacterium]|nr:hypothetical protein [Bacteroidia bacterium]
MKKIHVTIAAAFCAMLLVASCDKKEPLSSRSAAQDCEGCCTNVVLTDSISGPGGGLDSLPTALVGNYNAWNSVPYSFCDNTVRAGFEGHFNSFISGANGWSVGYFDESIIPYGTALSSLDCETLTGALIPVPSNVIGSQGYPTASDEGYYEYTPPGFLLSIFRYVALWKCCDDSMELYVIKVTDLQSNPTNTSFSGWTSRVVFDYKCFECGCSVPQVSARSKQNRTTPDVDANILLKAFGNNALK